MSLETIILTVGYPLVFFFIMGESAGIPMPGDTIGCWIRSRFSKGNSHS